MRKPDEYRSILQLWDEGFNKSEIERMTQIPRGTIHDCIKKFGSVAGLEAHAAEEKSNALLTRLQEFPNPAESALFENYAYVLGAYLGDGCISKLPRVYRLRIALDTRYPDIINACVQAIQYLLPENSVGVTQGYLGNFVEVHCSYKSWPEIIPQHGEGLKHHRMIQLTGWQQKIVDAYPLALFRGMYHTDGCRFSNIVKGKDYPRYQFLNYSPEIVKIFSDACDKLGLHWTLKKRKLQHVNATEVYISKRQDVEFLDREVGAKS